MLRESSLRGGRGAQHKADPDQANASDRATALHVAAQCAHAEIAEVLLEAKAQVNVAHNGGSTALHYAARRGAAELVALLLSAGAEKDAVNAVRASGQRSSSSRACAGGRRRCEEGWVLSARGMLPAGGVPHAAVLAGSDV